MSNDKRKDTKVKMIAQAVATAAALCLTGPAAAQGVQTGIVTTARISPRSPSRYVTMTAQVISPGTAEKIIQRIPYPFSGRARLVDVVVVQDNAGTCGSGTCSWSATLTANSTDMLATHSVLTQAAGHVYWIDAKGDQSSVPANCVRPVIKADGSEIVSKGTSIAFYLGAEGGTYSAHPVINLVAVFEPLQ